MEIDEFSKELIEMSNKIGIKLNLEEIEKLYKFMDLLLEWNEKINLTAITKPEDIILKHFIDSITIKKYIENKDKVLDMGTGAGFPGIPLKIMFPELKITLADSLNKRLLFLNHYFFYILNAFKRFYIFLFFIFNSKFLCKILFL